MCVLIVNDKVMQTETHINCVDVVFQLEQEWAPTYTPTHINLPKRALHTDSRRRLVNIEIVLRGSMVYLIVGS